MRLEDARSTIQIFPARPENGRWKITRPLDYSENQPLDLGGAHVFFTHMAVCQNLVPLVNIKIAGKLDVHPPKNGTDRYWSIAICGWGLP